MRIGFLNDKYLLGGREKVTYDMIHGITAINPDMKFFIITAQYKEYGLLSGAELVLLPLDIKMKKIDGMATVVNTIKKLCLDVLIIPIDPAPGLTPYIKKELPNLKLIVQYHSRPMWQVFNKTYNSPFRKLREKLFHTYTRRYLNRIKEECHYADAITCLCDDFTKQVKQFIGNKSDAQKIHTMYNPLDVPIYSSNNRKKEVIYVGRLSIPDKRVDRLMRIWQPIEHKHPDWKLKIIGIGEAESMMRGQVREMGLKNVEFCGYSSNPTEYYKTASILCLTSDYEGWPLVIAEGLACGITPVAMNCSPGINELLSDGRGFTIPVGNEKKFSEELDKIISFNINISNPKDFLKKLSIEKVCNNWIHLLNSLN